MTFEEDFPSLEYEGIDGEECNSAYNDDNLFYREEEIQKHCLDKQRVKELDDAAEMLWVVIANVSEGNWSKQSKEWQEAAARWRDNYFKVRKERGLKK